MSGKKDDILKCSFCGKTQDQVTRLIAGPGVYICDQCVELYTDLYFTIVTVNTICYLRLVTISSIKPYSFASAAVI